MRYNIHIYEGHWKNININLNIEDLDEFKKIDSYRLINFIRVFLEFEFSMLEFNCPICEFPVCHIQSYGSIIFIMNCACNDEEGLEYEEDMKKEVCVNDMRGLRIN